MRNVKADEFAKTLINELNEYNELVELDTAEAVKEVTTESWQIVKERAESYGWGSYPKKIAKSVTTLNTRWNRQHPVGTIYVKSPDYRRAHLLEHGHALRNGGRARAFPHFKYGEDHADKELEKRIKEKIE